VKSIDSLQALKHKPFRRLFIGATTSNIGTWIETVTVGIYLQSQTGDARYVAAGAAAGYLPHGIMGLVSGSIADRYPRRNILIINNLCSAMIAAFLAVSVEQNFATPLLVISLMFVGGFLNAISFPTWQAFLSDILPKERIAGALSLMFAQWNLGRIVGPAIAALLLAGEHYTIALGINAASFLFVVVMLLLVKKEHYQEHAVNRHTRKDQQTSILGGWKYIFNSRSHMKASFIVYMCTVVFAAPFIALIPNIADSVFNARSLGTSLFVTLQGLGAVVISIWLTTLHVKHGATRIQQYFLFGLPLVLVLFGLSPTLLFAAPLAFLFGVTYLGSLTSTTLAAQLAAPPELKGRISAAFMSTLGILFPISALIAGVIVNSTSGRIYFVGTGICLALALALSGGFSRSYKLPSEFVNEPDKEVGS
jgi:MFS family permease